MSVSVEPKPKKTGKRDGNWQNGDRRAGWGDPPEWTPHAKQRRRQMGLTEHRVEKAYQEPDLTYPSPAQYQRPWTGLFRECRQRGDIVVVCEGNLIITVLWHLQEGR